MTTMMINQENMKLESESLCPMIIIFNAFLDLAPRVEVIFNMGPIASHWRQSP